MLQNASRLAGKHQASASLMCDQPDRAASTVLACWLGCQALLSWRRASKKVPGAHAQTSANKLEGTVGSHGAQPRSICTSAVQHSAAQHSAVQTEQTEQRHSMMLAARENGLSSLKCSCKSWGAAVE